MVLSGSLAQLGLESTMTASVLVLGLVASRRRSPAFRVRRLALPGVLGLLGLWHGGALYDELHPTGASARVLLSAPSDGVSTSGSGGERLPLEGLPGGEVEVHVYGAPPRAAVSALGARLRAHGAHIEVLRAPAPLPFSKKRRWAWAMGAGLGACAVGIWWGRWLEGGDDDDDDPPPPDLP